MRKRLVLTVLLLALSLLPAAAGAEELIRIALVEGQLTAELSCEAPLELTEADGRQSELPAGKYFAHVEQGRLRLDEKHSFTGAVVLRPTVGEILPQVNRRTYQGSVQLLPQADGSLLVVNELPLESYLACVLPAKTMVVWPEEVIKAQAIAARSYALYKKQHSRAGYDLSDNDAELSYAGSGRRIEKAAVTELLQATAGLYLASADGLAIEAVTTSSSGGRTESARELWGREVSYLKSVEDTDSDSPEYSWEYRATPAILENLLAQRGYVTGHLTSLRLSPLEQPGADRTATSRVRYLMLSGEQGTVKLSGTELQELLGLNSTLFSIETGTPTPETLKVPIENYYGMEVGSKDIPIKVNEDERPVWRDLISSYHFLGGGKEEKIIFHGRGKGSGLGLSAWGARGLANAQPDYTYRELLAHYYPGARLRSRG